MNRAPVAQTGSVIGLFGGSFDPIHDGHLALAQAAVEQLHFDQLRFIPAGQPWQRQALQASALQRLAMLELALDTHPYFSTVDCSIDPCELQREGATYTYDTLCGLRKTWGDAVALVWIMGSDQWRNFSSWYRADELFSLAHFAVAERVGEGAGGRAGEIKNIPVTASHEPCYEASECAWRVQPSGSLIRFVMPPVAASATQLRGALAQGEITQAAQHLPAAVLRYIQQHQLYRPL